MEGPGMVWFDGGAHAAATRREKRSAEGLGPAGSPAGRPGVITAAAGRPRARTWRQRAVTAMAAITVLNRGNNSRIAAAIAIT